MTPGQSVSQSIRQSVNQSINQSNQGLVFSVTKYPFLLCLQYERDPTQEDEVSDYFMFDMPVITILSDL